MKCTNCGKEITKHTSYYQTRDNNMVLCSYQCISEALKISHAKHELINRTLEKHVR